MSHPAVDQERCIGCGLCERICPEVFALQDEQSNVTGQDACDSCDGEDSAESCPAEAVTIEDQDRFFH